jgi:peroxiredoxin
MSAGLQQQWHCLYSFVLYFLNPGEYRFMKNKNIILIVFVIILITHSLLRAQISEGDSILNFSIPEYSGNTLSLSQFGGEILVLNFFASWCIPCQTEAPLLQDSIWQIYKDQGVSVIGLAQEPLHNMDTFINDHDLSYPIGVDTAGIFFKAYGFQIIPSNILVNRDGKIVFIEEGFDIPLFIHLIDSLLAVTSIKPTLSGQIISPKNLTLIANYPNPFNSQTRIEFELAKAGSIELRVFSISGKQLYISQGIFNAGRQTISLALNNHASGVYLFSLQSENERVTGKVVLSK